MIKNNKCWWTYGEKGTMIHFWWECKLVQPLWRMVWRILSKLKVIYCMNQLSHFWEYIGWKCYQYLKDICTIMCITVLVTIAKIWSQPKCPSMDEWVKKMWYMITSVVFYPSRDFYFLYRCTWHLEFILRVPLSWCLSSFPFYGCY